MKADKDNFCSYNKSLQPYANELRKERKHVYGNMFYAPDK